MPFARLRRELFVPPGAARGRLCRRRPAARRPRAQSDAADGRGAAAAGGDGAAEGHRAGRRRRGRLRGRGAGAAGAQRRRAGGKCPSWRGSAARPWSITGLPRSAMSRRRSPAGHRQRAPYDVILFAGAVAAIPAEIERPAGRRRAHGCGVCGNRRGVGRATLITRTGGVLAHRVIFDAATPLLPGFDAEARVRVLRGWMPQPRGGRQAVGSAWGLAAPGLRRRGWRLLIGRQARRRRRR